MQQVDFVITLVQMRTQAEAFRELFFKHGVGGGLPATGYNRQHRGRTLN